MPTTPRVAIVTGSSRGLGRDTVLRLAERGVSSIVTYNVRLDAAQTSVADIEGAGAKGVLSQLDLRQLDNIDRFVAGVPELLRTLGVERFDYLVNNAGVASSASLETGTAEELDTLFAVHVKGPFLLTQKLLPLMNDGGRIVNMSSGLTRFSSRNRAVYAPMKGAVEVLTQCMAYELAPRRITANVVAPGPIGTDFGGGTSRDNPELNSELAGETLLGRIGVPEDVGRVVASLLSDDFRWVNSERIEISGGFRT